MAYEASFPEEPEQTRAATTFTVLSDRKAFEVTSLRRRTHYLSGKLGGTLWLDDNGDGMRGSAWNRTLNAMEFDTGIGGVNASLVRCADNVVVSHTASTPYSHLGVFRGGIQRRKTDDPAAGYFSFPIDGKGEGFVRAGRYYVMFQAPEGYRMGGNILPLGRRRRSRSGSSVEETVATEEERVNAGDDDGYECVPGGGEGIEYVEKAERIGDLDWEGYCARTVGCVEVDTKFDLEDRFGKLQFMEGEDKDNFEGTMRNLVALPKPISLNVGLAVQPWPLGTDQFSDSEFTISFLPGMDVNDLSAIVPAENEFSKSDIKFAMEQALAEYFRNNSAGAFDVGGFVLNEGKISPGKEKKETTGGGLLRRRRDLTKEEEEGATVTYSFTTRGRYNPPPYEPLGDIVSYSINADPVSIINSLQRRKDVSSDAKPALSIFKQSTGAETRHLTLKKPPPQAIVLESHESNLASWAIIPITVLSLSIASLIGVLLLRRAVGRWVVKNSAFHYDQNDPIGSYVGKGSGITAALYMPNNDKKGTNKKKKGLRDSKRYNSKQISHSNASSTIPESFELINTEDHTTLDLRLENENETQVLRRSNSATRPVDNIDRRRARGTIRNHLKNDVTKSFQTRVSSSLGPDRRNNDENRARGSRRNRKSHELGKSFKTHVTQRKTQLSWEEQIQEQGMIVPARPKRRTARNRT